MKRPTPLCKIHDSTLIFARLPDSEVWQTYRIARKTPRSVFITTVDGELQLDRIALERTGQVKCQGRLYCLAHPQLSPLDERLSS